MDLFWEEERKGQQRKRFYLSDANSAQDEELLCKNDIRAVVSIGADIMLPFSAFVRAHVFIPLLDLPDEVLFLRNTDVTSHPNYLSQASRMYWTIHCCVVLCCMA